MTEQTIRKYQEVLALARDFYRKRVGWVSFFREILGRDGLIRRVFPDAEARAEFFKSVQYAEIEEMLMALRKATDRPGAHEEPIRVITVRLPASVHEALLEEASDHNTSMNKLCITKLIQMLEDEAMAVEEG